MSSSSRTNAVARMVIPTTPAGRSISDRSTRSIGAGEHQHTHQRKQDNQTRGGELDAMATAMLNTALVPNYLILGWHTTSNQYSSTE